MSRDCVITRHKPPESHRFSLLSEIYVERGDKNDWNLLHDLHYKAENLGIGPRVYRAVLHDQVIGVGVMTVPKMLLSGRNEAFKHLRPNVDGWDTKLINKYRAEWINAHTCTNGRLVLDTMYRGAGIAYRMQNLMMRMTGCRYIEFQSSMSKLNPFASKAGIKFTKPRRSNNYAKGLEFFRRWFLSVPSDYVGIRQELDAMPASMRAKVIAETRKFYYQCSAMEKSGNNRDYGMTRVDGMEVGYLIKSLQQLVFASPLYGVYENPDALIRNAAAREVMTRLPLIAFDNQGTHEPLNLALAKEQMSKIVATTPRIELNWQEETSECI